MPFQNPRNLIPIDAAGAFLTAAATAFLLATQILKTGLPLSILLTMAAVAALYGVFGVLGFLLKLETSRMLQALAVLNLLYAIAAIAICAIHFNALTLIGTTYFAVEAFILFALSAFEWTIARGQSANPAS